MSNGLKIAIGSVLVLVSLIGGSVMYVFGAKFTAHDFETSVIASSRSMESTWGMMEQQLKMQGFTVKNYGETFIKTLEANAKRYENDKNAMMKWVQEAKSQMSPDMHIKFSTAIEKAYAKKEAKQLTKIAVSEQYEKFLGNSFKGIEAAFADLVAVQEGDLCSCCGEPLRYTKGIEAGHIFQLGTQYSEPLGATFLDENGKAQPMVMGTYGIGVSRLLAAIIEQNHDDKGCIWTKASAPFDLHILVSNIKDEAQVALGEKLYAQMSVKGVDVILDDRKDRFGAKMKDYELLGVPHAVVIGKKLSDGLVEFVTRDGMVKEEVSVDAVEALLNERF